MATESRASRIDERRAPPPGPRSTHGMAYPTRPGFVPPDPKDAEAWDRMGLDPSELDAAFDDLYHPRNSKPARRRDGIEVGRPLVWICGCLVGASGLMIFAWLMAGLPMPFRPPVEHYEFTDVSCVVTESTVEWSGSLHLDHEVMKFTWRPNLEVAVVVSDGDVGRRASLVTENYSLFGSSVPRSRPFEIVIPHDGDMTLPATCTTSLNYTSARPTADR